MLSNGPAVLAALALSDAEPHLTWPPFNAWLAQDNAAMGVRAGKSYVDVGTLGGYRQAIGLLGGQS